MEMNRAKDLAKELVGPGRAVKVYNHSTVTLGKRVPSNSMWSLLVTIDNQFPLEEIGDIFGLMDDYDVTLKALPKSKVHIEIKDKK